MTVRKMEKEKIMQIISVVVFLIGLILVGGFVYYIAFGYWWDMSWNHVYTWMLVIGLPIFIVGVILVNKNIRTST